jgi:hypothetical protein
MATKSMDQEHMLLIVILVGALLWMFLKNHKGDVCSLIGGNKETYVVGANWLSEAAGKVSNAASSAYGDVRNVVSKEATNLGHTAQNAYDGVRNVVDQETATLGHTAQGALQGATGAVQGLINNGEEMVINALESQYPVQTNILCSGINGTCGKPGMRSLDTNSVCGSELINMICKS